MVHFSSYFTGTPTPSLHFLEISLTQNKLISLFFLAVFSTYINNLVYLNYTSLILKVRAKDLINFLICLKLIDFVSYKLLMDLFTIDIPARSTNRFELNYLLLSLLNKFQYRMSLKTYTSELKAVESIIFIYASADWLERENWDMYGLFFKNHLDLRRILTDYGFTGFPLRKDFPVVGFLQLMFLFIYNKLMYIPLTLQQDLRYYEMLSPWIYALLVAKSFT